jgi:hypothetical protein
MILANAEWTDFARTVQRFLDRWDGSAIDLAHDAAMPSRVLNNGCDRSSNGDFVDAVGRSMVFSAAPADHVGDEDIAVRDLVQWECDGRLMFAEPRRVVSISENGKYVYVEGHATPLSTAEVTAVEANEGRLATPAALVPQGQKTTLHVPGYVYTERGTDTNAVSFCTISAKLRRLDGLVDPPAP